MTRPMVAYLRVSSEEQARGDRTSLAQQRDACTTLAHRLGGAITHWFEDAGASGGTARRPAFQALVAHCRQAPHPSAAPGIILVLNASRWGRFPDPNEAHWWIFELGQVGWTVRFAEGDESTDLTTQHVMRALGNSQATVYREAIRANARRGWQGTARQGFWQNEAPFGYRRLALAADGRTRQLDLGQRKSQDERVKLTPGPASEVALVQWLFRRYANGAIGLYRLAQEAHEQFPARPWSAQVVRQLLQNPAYVGDVVWGRRPQRPEGGRQSTRSDPATWVVTRDAHPSLVTRALFDQVRTRFATNQKQTRLPDSDYPLTGILTCAHCGDHYAAGGGKKGPPDDPRRFRFYRHATARRLMLPRHQGEPGCIDLQTSLRKHLVEPQVVAAVSEVVGAPRFRRVLERAIDRAFARLLGHPDQLRADLQQRSVKLEAERARLVKLAGQGLLAEEEIAPRIQALRLELESLRRQAQETRFTERRLTALQLDREALVARAADFTEVAKSLHGAALRNLLAPWIQVARVDRVRGVLELLIRPVPADAEVWQLSCQPGRATP